MIIKAVRFKRTKDSNWEIGIGFELNGISEEARKAERIISEEGVVEKVYIIQDDTARLCIDFKNIIY